MCGSIDDQGRSHGNSQNQERSACRSRGKHGEQSLHIRRLAVGGTVGNLERRVDKYPFESCGYRTILIMMSAPTHSRPAANSMCVTNRVPKGFGCQLPSLWPLYLWIWLGLGCTPVFAVDAVRSLGQFAHRSWGERDGAPTMPMALAQTSDGYLWAGGADGLIRFDGVRFEAFEPASSVKLPHKAVIHLL